MQRLERESKIGLLALSLIVSFALTQVSHADAVLMNCTIVNQSWTDCQESNFTCPGTNSSSLESLVLNMTAYFQNVTSQCSFDHDNLTLCSNDLAYFKNETLSRLNVNQSLQACMLGLATSNIQYQSLQTNITQSNYDNFRKLTDSQNYTILAFLAGLGIAYLFLRYNKYAGQLEQRIGLRRRGD